MEKFIENEKSSEEYWQYLFDIAEIEVELMDKCNQEIPE